MGGAVRGPPIDSQCTAMKNSKLEEVEVVELLGGRAEAWRWREKTK